MSDEHPAQIEFLCDPELLAKIPPPDRASRFLPDWFRNLERDMGMPDAQGLPGLTAKACLPMTDAFSLGYIIPLPYSIRIIIPDDRVNIQMGWQEDVAFQPVEQHHPGQIGAPASPFENVMPLKFVNPWRIKVDDGYSVLFTQPFNHAELPFSCFTGLVDCDRFHTTVNFPFHWTGPAGDFTLPAGLPIAQCIPVQRESLIHKHTVRGSTDTERKEQKATDGRKYGEVSTYAREWRTRK